MEEVYRLINRVQINKKEVKFSVSPENTIIVENVLLDAKIDFVKNQYVSKTNFKLTPNLEEEYAGEEFEIEFLDDEIIEEGQIF